MLLVKVRIMFSVCVFVEHIIEVVGFVVGSVTIAGVFVIVL